MDATLTSWDENWSKQLIQVFKCLLGPNFRISDDSVLHLLQDKIKTVVSSEELIRISQVEWFVASVLDYRTALNSSTLSFAVRIVGWLGETERWFVRYSNVVEKFLSTVCKDTGLLQNFSVISAVYGSLTKIASHVAGLTWILLDLGDFVQESYSLLTSGSSVFVDRAIVGFLATAWTNSTQWSGESSLLSGFTEDSLKRICHSVDTATNKLRNCSHASNTKGSGVTCILQLIEEVCNRCDILCNKILNSTKLYQNITDLIMAGTDAEQKIAMNILKIFIEKSSDAKVLEILEQFTDTLYTKEFIKMAQELTLSFLRKGYKQTRLTVRLLEPLKLAITENNGSTSSHFTCNTSKSQCLDRLCHCIACLEKTDLPVTSDVMRLFKMTCDLDTQFSLFRSLKLQRTCLNYLHKVIETGRLDPPSVQEVTSCLLEMLKSISVDYQIYSSCLKCLLLIAGAVLSWKEVSDDDNVGRKLQDIIQCHLCSIQWEIRDTTLEFLCQLLEKYKESKSVLEWFTSSDLHVHTWQCLSDSDSYVRATAITCISKMVPVDLVWQSLMSKTGLTETEIVSKVLTILQSDTEAFARRAAVKFIHSLYCHKSKVKETDKTVNIIMETLATSSSDFDWEVKLEGLELIQTLISEEADQFEEKLDNMPSYAEGLFKKPKLETSDTRESKSLAAICKLHLIGCWKSLFLALDDYDLTVCEKANKILTIFSHKLKGTVGDRVCEKISVKVDDIVHEQFNELERNKTNLVVDRNSHLYTDISRTLQSDPEDKWQNGPVGSGDNHNSNNKVNELCGYISPSKASLSSGRDAFKEDIMKVIEKIVDFKPPEKVANDNYDSNPFSLLDDIMSYAQKDEESNVVDCY